MDRIQPLFKIGATAVGGRNGHADTSDGAFHADFSVPKEMGGPGKSNTITPEHLFASGYAACFAGALDYVAKQNKVDATHASVSCTVSIGSREGGGFGLSVQMHVSDSSIPNDTLRDLVKQAHENICPYSHATRGNVEVTFEVVGS